MCRFLRNVKMHISVEGGLNLTDEGEQFSVL